MDVKNKQLKDVIDYSQTMLRDAESGNWKSVMEIEGQRSELLEKLFSTSHEGNNVDEMDSKIRQIIDINKKLETIAISSRDDSGHHIASMNNGRRAVNVYVKNSN